MLPESPPWIERCSHRDARDIPTSELERGIVRHGCVDRRQSSLPPKAERISQNPKQSSLSLAEEVGKEGENRSV
jgi:hypothetical protein